MGFKRTSDGRIFFQRSSDTSENKAENTTQHHPSSRQQQSKKRMQNPMPLTRPVANEVGQPEVLGLLRSLNERLHKTQNERKQMHTELVANRTMLKQLEERAQKAEEAYKSLEEKFVQNNDLGIGKAARAQTLAQEAFRELKETRKILMDLEDKTDRADRGVNTLKTELDKTKEITETLNQKNAKLESQSKILEDLSTRIESTEQKQLEMGNQIEESINQQALMMRKIEKSIEDRARFMRKIERIEETVLQTQDSLNAKAMVLLTDQNVEKRPKKKAALLSNDPNVVSNEQTEGIALFDPAWKDKLLNVKVMGGIAFLIVMSLLLGWGINEIQKPQLPDFSSISLEEDSAFQNKEVKSDITPDLSQTQTEANWNIDNDTSKFSEAPSEETKEESSIASKTEENLPIETKPAEETKIKESKAAAQKEKTPPNDLTKNLNDNDLIKNVDDIGMIHLQDQEKLAALLSDNPNELASVLNKIEPASIPSVSSLDTLKPNPDSKIIANIGSPAKNLESLITPDNSLPDIIKKIEDKAFDGNAEAQHDLAAIYTAGHGGVEQNYKRAAFWFEQAGKAGIANARYNLGVLYHQGLGVKQDLDKAINWYQAAADLNHPEAQYNLGIAYIEGLGVPYDPVRAAKYFENSANEGIMEAAYNLGLIYENGLLGTAKPDEALMWYKIASDSGSPEAKAALEQLAKILDIRLKDVNALAESMKESRTKTSTVKKNTKLKTNALKANDKLVPSPPKVAPAIQNNAEDHASSQSTTMQIQTYLMALGLYPGPAHGTKNPLTFDAIRAYQALHDLPKDGKPSEALLKHMTENSMKTAKLLTKNK